MPGVLSRISAATISAGIVLLVGAVLIAGRDLGHLSRHMSAHILAMNIAAPIVAALIVLRFQPAVQRPIWLWVAAVMQVAGLWGAHVPSMHAAAATSHLLQAGAHGILLLASLAFWIAVLAVPDRQRWHAIAALLVSGKLMCFLAILLVFAPRSLYGGGLHAPHAATLADQQFAGLLMIAACPLSYLTAAIIITVQLINGKMTARPSPAAS